jgi:sugar/nucleoside kinase (ribokinase family)
MARVLVIGHLTLDSICVRPAETSHFDVPQGAALGSALGAAATGADVTLVAVTGSDYPTSVLTILRDSGMTLAITRSELPTLRFWILRESSSFGIDLAFDAAPLADFTPAMSQLPEPPDAWDAAHICPMPIQDQIAWAQHLHGKAGLVSVDPQPFRYNSAEIDSQQLLQQLTRLVTVLSTSVEDFPELAIRASEGAPVELARLCPIIVVRRGADGSVITERGRGVHVIAAKPAKVVDATGAGDAYSGAFISYLALGQHSRAAADKAALIAAQMTESVGMLHLIRSSTGSPHSPSGDHSK